MTKLESARLRALATEAREATERRNTLIRKARRDGASIRHLCHVTRLSTRAIRRICGEPHPSRRSHP